ncbi:hypothetical protein PHSC3_000379 [Chlamydiales bacterium STE3]|nr:hypothetical protein PHSC3_000379 [Chlamydiales bacterium STE3]
MLKEYPEELPRLEKKMLQGIVSAPEKHQTNLLEQFRQQLLWMNYYSPSFHKKKNCSITKGALTKDLIKPL